jgi:hypothetical protein
MAGEYRQLFKDGLEMLMATDLAKGRMDRIPDMMNYLGKLADPDFKFGRIIERAGEHSGSQSWAPGELFLRS